MLKIESDNSIAVVSMDEYNKGKTAIEALMQIECNPPDGIEWIYIECPWHQCDVIIMKDTQAKLIRESIETEYFKREKALNTKLAKAKHIKWYHLLFGWKALDF